MIALNKKTVINLSLVGVIVLLMSGIAVLEGKTRDVTVKTGQLKAENTELQKKATQLKLQKAILNQ